MFEKLFLFFKGYIILKIGENSKERFLNLCKAKEIEIIDIVAINSTIYGKMSVKNYLKIKPIVKKTNCYPSIQKKAGFPFLLRKIQQRKGLCVGLLFAVLLLLQLTGRIWYIDVKGGFLHTREQIVQLLRREMQISAGMGRNTVDCMEIEEKLRLLYNEIGWVSVEKKGCNLYVRLNESVMPVLPEKQRQSCHIVAEKDGIVRKLEVLSGVAMVHIGDEVKQGDVLISGVIPLVGDYDNLMEKRPIGAEGNVYIESEFSYQWDCFRRVEEKIEKNCSTGLSFFFNELKLFSYIPRYSDGKYDIITNDIVPFVFYDFQLPFWVRIYKIREYETFFRQLEEEEVQNIAQEAWNDFLADWRTQGVEIRQEALSVEIGPVRCVASGKGIALGNFISYRKIKDEEWKINDEYSGNDS